jgi:hypothetical protein
MQLSSSSWVAQLHPSKVCANLLLLLLLLGCASSPTSLDVACIGCVSVRQAGSGIVQLMMLGIACEVAHLPACLICCATVADQHMSCFLPEPTCKETEAVTCLVPAHCNYLQLHRLMVVAGCRADSVRQQVHTSICKSTEAGLLHTHT